MSNGIRNGDEENNFDAIVMGLEDSVTMSQKDASLYQLAVLKEAFGSPYFTVELSDVPGPEDAMQSIKLSVNLGILSAPTIRFADAGHNIQRKWTELQRIYFLHLMLGGLKELQEYLTDKHEEFCPGEDDVDRLMAELDDLIEEEGGLV